MKRNSVIFGVLASGAVFVGGYYISKLIWKYIDEEYAHGLGLSHLFLLLLFFCCVGWFVIGVIKRKNEKSGRYWIGTALMNFCFITGSIIYLFVDFNEDSGEKVDLPSQSITIMKDTASGNSVIVNQDRDTLIYKKGDSNMIDRTREIDLRIMKIKDTSEKVQ